MSKNKGKLILLSGPPAAGKDTVMKALLNKKELELEKIVTYTTRARRENETQGYDYHFVTTGKFYELIYKQEIIEYVYHGSDWKGSHIEPFRQLLEEKVNFIWRITTDRGGTLEEFLQDQFDQSDAKKLLENTTRIYVGPNDKEILKQRYLSRVSNPNLPEFEKRFDQDMQSWETYKDRFDHYIDNRGSLDRTLAEALEIVGRL